MKYVLALSSLLLVPALTMGATMSLTSGGNSSIPVTLGGVYPVVLKIDTQGALMAGYQVTLHSSSLGTSPSVSVSGYSIISNLLPALGTFNGNLGTADRGPAGGTDNTELLDENGDPFDPAQFENLGPGVVQVATFNVTVSASYAGSFPIVLSLLNPLVSNEAAQSLPVNGLGSLTLTPEPVSLLLLGVGGLMLRRRR